MNPQLLWLIPLLPFAGFLLNGFFGRRMPKMVVWTVAHGSVALSFIIAVIAFVTLKNSDSGAIIAHWRAWIPVPGIGGDDGTNLQFLANHRLVFDNLSAIMTLVVTGVGWLIHFYSHGYMHEEKRYARFFAYLNLFTGFMLILVLGSNLFLMFVGWEGVGLCSYLLIGFWFEEEANAKAGKKAFIVNRVGDLMFTIGVMTLFVYMGTLKHPDSDKPVNAVGQSSWTIEFSEIEKNLAVAKGIEDDRKAAWEALPESEKQANPYNSWLSIGILTFIGLMLFGGATGKSAQIPLYVWLPDAMAGPTPVSALIHAATMVTAGVYMVARMGFLYLLAPYALLVITVVGCATAIFAGLIAVTQNDIKKVLAYSTVSQLGYMFMGVGSGFFFAGIFHLMTHAFFKACLFLGSGSVIMGMHHEQDIRKMGGLFKKMPITAWTFIISTLALAGLPFVTSGFWSKESVLGAMWTSTYYPEGLAWLPKALVFVGFAGAGLTAFYMTRLVIKTFFQKPRWKDAHKEEGHGEHGHDDHGHHGGEPHESPMVVTFPLIVLAVLSVVGGFAFLFNTGAWLSSAEIVDKATPHGAWHYIFWGLSFVTSVGGIFLGYKLYWKDEKTPERIAESNKDMYEAMYNKFYVDEAYEKMFVQPLIEMNELVGRADNVVIDGFVNGVAGATGDVSQSTGYVDNELVDGAVNGVGASARGAGGMIRRLQTGNIKSYLTGAVVGGLFLIASYCVYLARYSIREWLDRIF